MSDSIKLQRQRQRIISMPSIAESLQMAQDGSIFQRGFALDDIVLVVVAMTNQQQYEFVTAINARSPMMAHRIIVAENQYWTDHPEQSPGMLL